MQQGSVAVPTVVTRILADYVRMFLPSDYWNRARDWFDYSLDTTLAASTQTPDSFNVQNDSDFLCLAIVGTGATTSAGTTELTYWPQLISIVDSASGVSWFGGSASSAGANASFTHIQNVVGRMAGGTAGIALSGPGLLEQPRFIPGAATVNVIYNNLAATTPRMWLTFRGIKIYRNARQGV